MAIPNLWRTKKQRYSLQGAQCPACQHTFFPPRQVCPHCSHDTAAPEASHHDEARSTVQPYMLLFHLPQAAELTVGDD